MTPIVRNADQKTISAISSEVLYLFEYLKMFASFISLSLVEFYYGEPLEACS